MPKAKTILSVLIVSLALVVLPTTASATSMSWFVNGSRLVGTEALGNTTRIDKPLLFNVPALSLKVSCKALSGEGVHIFTGEDGAAKKLKFEGCSEVEPTGCELTTSEIPTEPVLGLQILGLLPGSKTESVFTLIHPQKPSGILAEVNFTGSHCAGAELAVKGLIKTINPTALTENTLQTGEALGSFENDSVIGGGHPVYLESGKTLLSLTSGSAWSFHE